jgi:hypothetical protein
MKQRNETRLLMILISYTINGVFILERQQPTNKARLLIKETTKKCPSLKQVQWMEEDWSLIHHTNLRNILLKRKPRHCNHA